MVTVNGYNFTAHYDAAGGNFDLIAIQEVRSVAQDIMPHLIEMLNADGHQYDYAIGPRLGRTASKEQYAFVFDTQTIEIDRYQLYTVDDPDDLLHREPLVGWFRERRPVCKRWKVSGKFM